MNRRGFLKATAIGGSAAGISLTVPILGLAQSRHETTATKIANHQPLTIGKLRDIDRELQRNAVGKAMPEPTGETVVFRRPLPAYTR